MKILKRKYQNAAGEWFDVILHKKLPGKGMWLASLRKCAILAMMLICTTAMAQKASKKPEIGMTKFSFFVEFPSAEPKGAPIDTLYSVRVKDIKYTVIFREGQIMKIDAIRVNATFASSDSGKGRK